MIIQQEAIILRAIDYSDTSQIFTLFTPDSGKVGIIAKGLKKNKNPYQGGMQVLNHIDCMYYQKREEHLGIFKECEIKSHFPEIRAELPRLWAALSFVELLREMTAEKDPNLRLFRLLRHALSQLAAGIAPSHVLFYFEWHALSLLGFAPLLSSCIQCGQPLQNQDSVFSLRKGASYCQACKKLSQGELLPLSARTIQKLEVLVHCHNATLNDIPLTASEHQQLLNLFHLYLRYFLNKELRLARYWKELALPSPRKKI